MDDPKTQPPTLASLEEMTILNAIDGETNEFRYVTFYHITSDDKLYFGQLHKQQKDITLAEYNSALSLVNDEEVFPLIPEGVDLKIADGHWDDTNAFIKRPGLHQYEIMRDTDFVPKQIQQETLIMEQLSRAPHPNIITYLGCREPDFHQLYDHDAIYQAIESAIRHIHAMGLAHNDINPDNIMFRDGTPLLIDFGSCQPFGEHIQSTGTEGWMEEDFYTSEAKHDDYSLRKLKEWLQNPNRQDMDQDVDQVVHQDVEQDVDQDVEPHVEQNAEESGTSFRD
ncbi:kinase-like domain-containing protein [Xylariaceae sp. FL0594]|nr:kinase-like domain-containing protein [Xylariaceae sp. FL0594]